MVGVVVLGDRWQEQKGCAEHSVACDTCDTSGLDPSLAGPRPMAVYCQNSTVYPCVPGKRYYGRGPIQVSLHLAPLFGSSLACQAAHSRERPVPLPSPSLFPYPLPAALLELQLWEGGS